MPSLQAVTESVRRWLGGPGSGNFGHEGRPGEVGGSAGSGSSETPIQQSGWQGHGAAREQLRSINGGIGSTMDDEKFFETLRSMHNQGQIGPLLGYAKENPEQFARMQRVMRFDAWQDSNTKVSFQTWENGKVMVYRGVAPSSDASGHAETGRSWSLSSDTAKSFSIEGTSRLGWHESGGKVGRVITKEISPKEMFAYSNQQGEQEVVLHSAPRHASSLSPRQQALLLLCARMRVEVRRANEMRHAGDAAGHEFHGNQWTSGGGTKEDFIAIGRTQRDKPETAMNDAVHELGGGPLSHVLEHVGDLNHRMNDANTFDTAGYNYVKTKVDGSLNVMNNAADFRSIVHTDRTPKQVEALGKYANAHRALPAYNEAHALARTAATALGEQKYFVARKALTELQTHLKSKDEWVSFARKNLRTAGDVVGHEFHGNQYTPGSGAPTEGRWVRDSSGDAVKWEQSHDALVKDALTRWKGDSSDLRMHADDATKGAPQPSSGGGKQVRAQSEALLWELSNHSKTNDVTLYRASGPTKPGSMTSWTESKKVANEFAAKAQRAGHGPGTIHVAAPGTVKGIRIGDYRKSGNDTEREWITAPKNPRELSAFLRALGMRSASRNTDNTPLHRAADAHLQIMILALRAAFNVARKALKGSLRAAGDVEGHEFHGNQYTSAGGDAGYVYHYTSKENADKITKSGFEPRTPVQGFWPDGSTEARTYFSKDPSYHARMYAGVAKVLDPKGERKMQLLRVKESDLQLKRDRDTQEYYVTHDVHSSKIERTTLRSAASNRLSVRPMSSETNGAHISSNLNERLMSRFQTENEISPTVDALDTRTTRAASRLLDHKDILTQNSEKVKGLASSIDVDACISTLHAALLKVLPPVLAKVYVAGGNAGIGMLPKRMRGAEDVEQGMQRQGWEHELRALKPQVAGKPHSTVGPFGLAFNVDDPNAIKWAREHTSKIADDISQTSKDRINEAVAQALEGDGLDAAYDDILAAVGDESRADMIARTETMTASNQGALLGFEQAQDAGLLPADAQKVWIATSDCCDDCEALDEEEVGIDKDFSSGDDAPPAHPNCRCCIGIAGGAE